VPYIDVLFRCPVCNSNLADLGPPSEQEFHVKNCLDGGSGTPQAAKYLVYKLPAESALIGVECVICLEEFAKGTLYAHTVNSIYLILFRPGSLVARLSCLCSFHNGLLYSVKNLGSVSLHLRLQLAYHLGCSVEGAALSMLADPYPYQFFAVVPYSLPHSTSHRNVTYNMQWKVTGISSRPKLMESIIIARFVESTVMELAAIYSDYI
jgi:hypothetical protein